MNRAIKDATVKRFYYETHDQLCERLPTFVAACIFARRPKTRDGLTHPPRVHRQMPDEGSPPLPFKPAPSNPDANPPAHTQKNLARFNS